MGNRKSRVIELPDWAAERDRQVVARLAAPPRVDKPLSRNHLRYMETIRTSKVAFAIGPAGTGKTTLAAQVAVELLRAGQIQQIVLTRPLVTCGRELGFLPGNEAEKMGPYLAPLAKAIQRYMPAAELEKLRKAEVVQVASLEVMRGNTYANAVVICDEAQNATYEQCRMLLTRLGSDSRIVMTGDISQSDVCPGAQNPFAQVILKLEGIPEVSLVKMTRDDCLRPWLVQEIDQRLT